MINLIQKLCDKILKLFHFPDGHPYDYIAHYILSVIGVFIMFLIFRFINFSIVISLGSAAVLMALTGIIKESIDKYLGRTDCLRDIMANTLGIITAILVILKIWIY